jgi:hypothetical protein
MATQQVNNQPERWRELCDDAEDFDLVPTVQGDTFFFLRTGPGPDVTASFPFTEQGVAEALVWLDDLEEEYYE